MDGYFYIDDLSKSLGVTWRPLETILEFNRVGKRKGQPDMVRPALYDTYEVTIRRDDDGSQ